MKDIWREEIVEFGEGYEIGKRDLGEAIYQIIKNGSNLSSRFTVCVFSFSFWHCNYSFSPFPFLHWNPFLFPSPFPFKLMAYFYTCFYCICICMYMHIYYNYNLFTACHVHCLYVFRVDTLVLEIQLSCFSLEEDHHCNWR